MSVVQLFHIVSSFATFFSCFSDGGLLSQVWVGQCSLIGGRKILLSGTSETKLCSQCGWLKDSWVTHLSHFTRKAYGWPHGMRGVAKGAHGDVEIVMQHGVATLFDFEKKVP